MSLETEVQALTVATTDLLEAVNIGKQSLDAAENAAELAAAQALTSASNSATSASQSAGSASQALTIYSNTAAMQTAVSTAQAAASLAEGHAASASSVVQQDLSGINAAALHRSPNAVTAMFVYDTGRDSDGGAWTEKCQHTSWYNEALSGKWLGAQASEAAARAVSGAATGDYFQRTSDGLFYRLNATSGTTEVFRGNKRDFPRLAGIVAEAGNVTIYDLTEPGRPMWMRFGDASLTANSLGALGGKLLVSRNTSGLLTVDFIADRIIQTTSSGTRFFNQTIGSAIFKSTWGSITTTAYVAAGAIVNATVNAVSATVLPDAPIDPVTGLRIPTIAVATNGGVSVIRHSGTVESKAYGSALLAWSVAFRGRLLLVGGIAPDAFFGAYTWDVVDGVVNGYGAIATVKVNNNIGYAKALLSGSTLNAIQNNSLTVVKDNKSSAAKGIQARIANTFNTGWMTGDIRRAYLADVGAGSATGTVSDRSYKAASATITGTLVKSEVSAAAQLVAYNGFSAANYAQEPYHADLDFGTGEWTGSAWLNIPSTLPVSSFPAVGSELWSDQTPTVQGFSGGAGTYDDATNTMNITTFGAGMAVSYRFNLGLATGRLYRIQGVLSGNLSAVQSLRPSLAGTSSNVAVNTTTGEFSGIVEATQNLLEIVLSATAANSVTINSISVVEAGSASIADRAAASGPRLRLGVNALGRLTATAFDGTTTRTVTSTAAYNTATWLKARVNYTTDGTLALLINGVLVAATRGNPLLTLNNASAVLTMGNSFALDAPFPGSIALLKLSATVPTAEQAAWMYEQEKHLFQAGAQCCLPDAGAIADLTYDDATDKWIAISATNESEWSGLVRTSVTAVPAGSYTRAVAGGGVQLLARSTTSPGVDVTIPAYGLREELVKRAESAARLNAQTATYDYVGGFTANTTTGNTAILTIANLTYPTRIQGARVTGTGIPANATLADVSGTTGYLSAAATATGTAVQINLLDFALPTGLTATAVSVNGVVQREGPTAAYTRLFDGFREVIRFAVAPGNTAWVQIQTVRSAA